MNRSIATTLRNGHAVTTSAVLITPEDETYAITAHLNGRRIVHVRATGTSDAADLLRQVHHGVWNTAKHLQPLH